LPLQTNEIPCPDFAPIITLSIIGELISLAAFHLTMKFAPKPPAS
jgi:hypothetical protein